MCILIHQKEGVTLDADMIADFYQKNSDGFGALLMLPDASGKEHLTMIKKIGGVKSIAETYYEHIAGRNALMHFRWRTHGEVDLENCHPYKVTDDLWMMHNGVLHTGNEDDKSKSDTWHYIRKFLLPIIRQDPSLIFDAAFRALVESHIGASNKFAFMDTKGRIALYNQKHGVEHMNCWFSNTYAWSPSKFGYVYKYESQPTSSYSSYTRQAYQGDLWKSSYTPPSKSYKSKDKDEKKENDDEISERIVRNMLALDNKKRKPRVKAKTGKITEKTLKSVHPRVFRRILIKTHNMYRRTDGQLQDFLQWIKFSRYEAMIFLMKVYNWDKSTCEWLLDVEDNHFDAANAIIEAWCEGEDEFMEIIGEGGQQA